MHRVGILHLRTIKRFSKVLGGSPVKEFENYLSGYVSLPTARKIIKELIELGVVEVRRSASDKRVKLLTVVDANYERFLDI